METELKLKMPMAMIERLRSLPWLTERSSGAPIEHHLVDTYFDTPQRDLWKHGLVLCVRNDNGKWIQTVKTAAATSASLHQRGEWEGELQDEAPRPELLVRQVKPAKLAKLLASEDIAKGLSPVFQNTTHRTTWNIALPDGDQVECALDAGDINCGDQHTSISELELELKHGDPSELFNLALQLHREIPFQMANDSKAARCFAMLDNEPVQARKAVPVRLHRKMTLEDGFQAIAVNCLQQIESNVPGVLKKDVESLHQMRVGLRRLRALVSMFEALVLPPAEIAKGLDWLADELGPPRDWDVLVSSTLGRIVGLDEAVLRDAAEAKATELHRQLAQTLRAPHYTLVILQLSAWLHGRQWRSGGVLPKRSPLAEPVGHAARPLLQKAEKRLSKRIRALDSTDADARHRTRIAAKKARYAAEFFRDLMPERRVKRYVSHLSKLQDRLGLLNDMAVAEGLLDQLKGSNAQVARQAAYARGYLVAIAAADSAQINKTLGAVAKMRITR